MTQPSKTNLGASVRQRLLNLSRREQENFNLLLSRYAIERLLYRLSQSSVAEQFVLKGAALFAVWTGKLHRPTQDLDLLGYGDSSIEHLQVIFTMLCTLPVEADGLTFDSTSIRIEEIREGLVYGGQRVHLVAYLDGAIIPVQIDIGFGDAVMPSPTWLVYPTLLTFPPPQLRMYPKESVIAEKVHAMVVLDIDNSRMKDFYDLWTLSRLFHFEGTMVAQAIQATFERRQTPLPLTVPTGLTVEFADDPNKLAQWRAFLSRNRLDVGSASFADIIVHLHTFLWPPLQALAESTPFIAQWPPQGPWRPVE